MTARGFLGSLLLQPQNNWLFSQHISYENAIEVFVNISIDLSQCSTHCLQYVTMYKYDTSLVDVVQRTNPQNYVHIRRLVHDQGLFEVHFSIPLTRPQTTASGFYLGFQDNGTDGQINRVIVFYRVARGRKEDLLSCPDVPLPVQGSISQENCSCVDTASSTSSSLIRRCNAEGVCNEDQVCACKPGFQLTEENGIHTCTGIVDSFA